ncbi:MAG: glycosyltransferase family 2 protein [Candidatus Omnitrophica bacterium]|nr:glycosyltransferase family 2 protein [Candidatus Omnitrophota bacterium]MDD5552813.1 glycosyltransferase family 2 protein [Candidatus Omnitrophota bacterium]
MKNGNAKTKRYLEIIPACISWGILIFLACLSIFRPILSAILIIIFEFYWNIRTIYLTTLLVLAYKKLSNEKNRDWLSDCVGLAPKKDWAKVYHLIIFPVYKEGLKILRPSLKSLADCQYPKEKMIVVMAFEERSSDSRSNAAILEEEFKSGFFGYISTFHPDGIPGESRTKGANATWAAKQAKEFLDKRSIAYEDILISCFDADTCVDKQYFACLTYHFLTSSRPHQASYQPMPVYNNNIWYAPAFARLVETSGSFCQMIESMRLEKFVTFSSHSMSFKTLVAINYWPVNMISDDSVVYWKAFLYYKGDYRVVPLYITVSMDAAYSTSIFKTVVVQYKQKRRWAWGVENFPFLVEGLIHDKKIPLAKKIRRSFNLLESHISWAVWAMIIMLITPLPILFGGAFFSQTSIGYNLPRIGGLLLNFALGTSLIWIVLSMTILPKRPPDVKWFKYIMMVIEWALAPVIILILGSTPALDAQTRLALGKYMQFYSTEKVYKNIPEEKNG